MDMLLEYFSFFLFIYDWNWFLECCYYRNPYSPFDGVTRAEQMVWGVLDWNRNMVYRFNVFLHLCSK